MKALVPIIAVVVIAGGVVGAGLMGIINIPGFTPKKKGGGPNMYGVEKDGLALNKDVKPAEAPKMSAKKPPTQASEKASDPTLGATKLAGLWNEMDAATLVKMVADWKEDQLALVVYRMDEEKAAALLAKLPANVASKVSKQIQKIASNSSKT